MITRVSLTLKYNINIFSINILHSPSNSKSHHFCMFPMKIVCVQTTQWIFWRGTKHCSFLIFCCYGWTWPIFLKIQNLLSLFLKEKSVLFAQSGDTEIPQGLTWVSYKMVILLCADDILCSLQYSWFQKYTHSDTMMMAAKWTSGRITLNQCIDDSLRAM